VVGKCNPRYNLTLIGEFYMKDYKDLYLCSLQNIFILLLISDIVRFSDITG